MSLTSVDPLPKRSAADLSMKDRLSRASSTTGSFDDYLQRTQAPAQAAASQDSDGYSGTRAPASHTTATAAPTTRRAKNSANDTPDDSGSSQRRADRSQDASTAPRQSGDDSQTGRRPSAHSSHDNASTAAASGEENGQRQSSDHAVKNQDESEPPNDPSHNKADSTEQSDATAVCLDISTSPAAAAAATSQQALTKVATDVALPAAGDVGQQTVAAMANTSAKASAAEAAGATAKALVSVRLASALGGDAAVKGGPGSDIAGTTTEASANAAHAPAANDAAMQAAQAAATAAASLAAMAVGAPVAAATAAAATDAVTAVAGGVMPAAMMPVLGPSPNVTGPATATSLTAAEHISANTETSSASAVTSLGETVRDQPAMAAGDALSNSNPADDRGGNATHGSHSTAPSSAAATAASTHNSPSAASGRNNAQAAETALSQADRVRFVQRVEQAFRDLNDQGGNIRLRLSPPELGSLRIEIKVAKGEMTARVEADTPSARNLLLDNLPALRDRLAQHDIRVQRFDVDLMDHSAGGMMNQSSQQQTPSWQNAHAGAVRAAGRSAAETPVIVDATPVRTATSEGRLNVVV